MKGRHCLGRGDLAWKTPDRQRQPKPVKMDPHRATRLAKLCDSAEVNRWVGSFPTWDSEGDDGVVPCRPVARTRESKRHRNRVQMMEGEPKLVQVWADSGTGTWDAASNAWCQRDGRRQPDQRPNLCTSKVLPCLEVPATLDGSESHVSTAAISHSASPAFTFCFAFAFAS